MGNVFEIGGSQKSLHSWKRGTNPLFYGDPHIAYPCFFKFCPPLPATTFLSPPTPAPTVLSAVLFLWLNEWSCHIWCAIVLNDNMDHCICQTLVPYGPWCVFYATMCHLYWSLTQCDFLLVPWFDITHTHTHTHTEHTQGPVDWHIHI